MPKTASRSPPVTARTTKRTGGRRNPGLSTASTPSSTPNRLIGFPRRSRGLIPRSRPSKPASKILRNSGAEITHDQADRAFYSRSTDSIHLPLRELFRDAPGYYGTALHELAHWTGHPERLNRQTLNESYRFGDQNYAREELRAELASLFLAAERGIPHDPGQHASYVSSWIKALRDDKNEIFRAAYDASRASEFLLALERDKSLAQSLVASPETSAAALEQEAARIQSDLEAQPDVTVPNPEPVVQESGQAVGRFRPQDGTLKNSRQSGRRGFPGGA